MAARDTKLYSFLLEALATQAKRHRNHQPLLEKFTASGYSLSYPVIYKWSRRIFPKTYYLRADESHPESRDEANLEMAELIEYDFENPSVDKNNDPLAPFRSDEHSQVEALESDKTHSEFEKELAEEKTREQAATHSREPIHAGGGHSGHLSEKPEETSHLTPEEQSKLKQLKAHPDAVQARANINLTDQQRAALQRIKETHPDILARSQTQVSKAFTNAFENVAESNVSKNLMSKIAILLRRFFTKFLSTALGVIAGMGIGNLLGGPAIGLVTGVLGGVIGYRVVNPVEDQEESGETEQVVYSQPNYFNKSSGGGPNLGLIRRLLGRGGGGIVRAGASAAAKRGLFALIAANPEIWIPVLVVIGVILLIVTLFLIINSFNRNNSLFPPFDQPTQNTTATQTTTSAPLIIQKTGPNGCITDCVINNGDDIQYTITAIYNGQNSADVEIDDLLPSNVVFKDASDGGTPQGNTVVWNIAGLTSGQQKALTLTVTPTSSDDWVVNQTQARITNSSTDQQLNNNDCSGKYSLGNPLGNFGDPGCNYNDSDLYQALQNADPTNADFWFNVVIPCESSFNPNSYNPAAVDSAGAWGLFQMGRGKNGDNDHGDVDWPQQVSNATSYQQQSNSWLYWACASGRW